MKNQPPMNLIIKEKQSLWLGDYRAARNIALLKNNNIKTIVAITSKNLLDYPEGYTKYYFMYRDKPDSQINQIFEKTNLIIDSSLQKHSVLVHCMAGISRSTTIVLAYLMKIKQWSLKDAFLYVKTIRPIVQPNSGFQQQLFDYQKYLADYKPSIPFSPNMTITSTEEEKLGFRIEFAKKQSQSQLGLEREQKNLNSKKKIEFKKSYLSIYKQLEYSQQMKNLDAEDEELKRPSSQQESQNTIRLRIAKKYLNYNLYKNFAV